jgi:hypothetical protein
MEAQQSSYSTPPINFSVTQPVPELTGVYDEKYARFLKYQHFLS